MEHGYRSINVAYDQKVKGQLIAIQYNFDIDAGESRVVEQLEGYREAAKDCYKKSSPILEGADVLAEVDNSGRSIAARY